jgi:hypothetical protein
MAAAKKARGNQKAKPNKKCGRLNGNLRVADPHQFNADPEPFFSR